MSISYPVPRFLTSGDEPFVRDIHRICHPNEPARAPAWYFINPTLVIEDYTKNNLIIGFTSFAIAESSGALTLFGRDVCVLPEYQGQELANVLHAARLTLAQRMGAKVFIGATKDRRMARVLEKFGAHKCLPLDNDGTYLYMSLIKEI